MAAQNRTVLKATFQTGDTPTEAQFSDLIDSFPIVAEHDLKAPLISPAFTTPDLGTPSAGVATNLTGTAANLTAGQATAALGIKTATTTVSVFAATAPTTGQVLTATSTTNATWQTPSGGGGTPTVITVANEASDTTCFPAFFTAATGDIGPKTNAGLTFNAATGQLNVGGDIVVSKANGVRFYLKDSSGIGNWNFAAADAIWTGVPDYTMAIHFNEDAAIATQPQWGENWESRYVDGAPPLGLFEKNWSYTNIARTISYRPYAFNVDLNTSIATNHWQGILQGGKSNDSTIYWRLNCESSTRYFSINGTITAGSDNVGANRMNVVGTPIANVMLNVTATTPTAGDVLASLTYGTVTGAYKFITAQGTASGTLSNEYTNNGSGGVLTRYVAGGTNDAWIYTGGNSVDWAFGIDGSDSGKWKLSNSTVLGTNDRITVTPDGLLSALAGLTVSGGSLTATTINAGSGTGRGVLDVKSGTASLYVTDGGNFPTITLGGSDTGVAAIFSRLVGSATIYFGEVADAGGVDFRGVGAASFSGSVISGSKRLVIKNFASNATNNQARLCLLPHGGFSESVCPYIEASNVTDEASIRFATFTGGGDVVQLTIAATGGLTAVSTNTHTFGTTNTVTMTAGVLSATGNIVSSAGRLIVTTPVTPASASASGTVGTVAWDTSFLYVCTDTNTWKRAAIATW